MHRAQPSVQAVSRLNSQDIVQYIYEALTRMRNQNYKDDLTMFIIKNKSDN